MVDDGSPLDVRLRERDGDAMVVTVTGEVDADNNDQLRQQILDLIPRGAADVALDLSGLSFLSSAGIQTLLECHEKVSRQGGRFVVSRAHDNVRQVLVICELTEFFQLTAADAR
ncbi:STAS domain-containing protein [Paractinoplanes abujensis]|uniref:Anti-sigma factor antagonist n=1 Tax=Paractinoplanes abujensis TaxID=882441 RepID=A0A7W7CQY9_9ACTN|nr:STAS domain-containing protein [Actinoplanes abujensis]MBB4693092.1 anti-sigma B factor antagonist [Actinoplanes abujensis]